MDNDELLRRYGVQITAQRLAVPQAGAISRRAVYAALAAFTNEDRRPACAAATCASSDD